MKAKEYSFAEITEAILLLRENKGSLNKTAKSRGVSIDTLKRWRDRYATELWNAYPITLTSYDAQIKEELNRENKDVREAAKVVARKALDTIGKRIDDGLIGNKDLIEVIKVTAPYLLPRFDEDGGRKSGHVSVENNYTVFVQKMYNNLKHGNGTKTITIEGNTAELSPGE